MTNFKFETLYKSGGYSVSELFDISGQGFAVPEYQRDYTWEGENIDQLLVDLRSGVGDLTGRPGDSVATFLGTIILTGLDDIGEVYSGSGYRPAGVQIVIDGQQRISTIALMAIQLTKRLKMVCEKLPPEGALYEGLRVCCENYRNSLRNLYAVRFSQSSQGEFVPRIICIGVDKWGPMSERKAHAREDELYKTPIASYIANYIRSSTPLIEPSTIDFKHRDARIDSNIQKIERWLNEIFESFSTKKGLPEEQLFYDDKLVAAQIQTDILGSELGKLRDTIVNKDIKEDTPDYYTAATYCVLVLSYYLLHRCGVNLLEPTREDLGYDMFQSLNSTGVPLTALEVIRPAIMKAERPEGEWNSTESAKYMDLIDKLLDGAKSNQEKNSRINQLLNAFALCYRGDKLGNLFHVQRKWLQDRYGSDEGDIHKKRKFLKRLSMTADFFCTAWHRDEGAHKDGGAHRDEGSDPQLTLLLLDYLKVAHSKMSATILARFFCQVPEGKSYLSDLEFYEAARACAAFFTLWRSSHSTTSGLDKVYRDFYQGGNKDENLPKPEGRHWTANSGLITSEELKEHFRDVMKPSAIMDDCEEWIKASSRSLRYDELQAVSRFALFLAGHNRVADKENPGLTVAGKPEVLPLLTWEHWDSPDYKSIEHIAPRKPEPGKDSGSDWDTEIYKENRVHEVGNLLLFPKNVNSYASNQGWEKKLIYYGHIGCKTEKELEKWRSRAGDVGVKLNDKARETLRKVKYSGIVEPILEVDKAKGMTWDSAIIDRRTRHIKEVVWEELIQWLK